MKRLTRLTLALSTVALLTLLLVLVVGAQPVTRTDGGTIKVPDDYATIQAAIDAAADGDTVLVAAGTYTENLSITRGITLSGGWNITFTARTDEESVIDGNALGRVISVTCVTSDTQVIIDGFTIQNGDATGLGAPALPGSPRFAVPLFETEAQPAALTSDLLSPSEQAEQLRARLDEVVARGQYPGGADAYQVMLEQLAWRTAQAERARSRTNTSLASSQNQPDQGTGVGGGVYSSNASLHLYDNTIQYNLANQNGEGVGGGVYVGNAPPNGVQIVGNSIAANVASGQGEGMGGGMTLFMTPDAVVTHNVFAENIAAVEGKGQGGGLFIWFSAGARIADDEFLENAASIEGDGFGGGLLVTRSPGIIIDHDVFFENIATDTGSTQGFGGGLMVASSKGAIVSDNEVERNTANGSWLRGLGAGGGLFLTSSDEAQASGNTFRSNLAALRGFGEGGGLTLYITQYAHITENKVTENWSVMYQGDILGVGGGIALDESSNITLSGNDIQANTAVVYEEGLAAGGGVAGAGLGGQTRIVDNNISGNVACYSASGQGGGVSIEGAMDLVVTGNTMTDNVASLQAGQDGTGGGMHLADTAKSQVSGNRFQGNRAGDTAASSGGGLTLVNFESRSGFATVDANQFLDNQPGGVEVVLIENVSLTNNVVANNKTSAFGGIDVALVNEAEIVNNTIADNGFHGVTIGMSTTMTLTNNIVVSHTVGISVTEGATATVGYTLWDDNDTDIGGGGSFTHTHPVYGDPAFVDPSDHDYHLTVGSAARDAGDPAGVPPAPDHDFDGVARPQGMAVDIGAYEWQGYYQYLPLVMKTFYRRTGWAIGQDENNAAAIVHTIDGGLTWERQGDSAAWTGLGGNDISAVDDETAWAALGNGPGAPSGIILHTTDGGANWVSQTIPNGLAGGIKGIKGLSRDEAWAASLGGSVLHTTDGGANWNIVPHPTVAIKAVNRIDAMGSDVWIADADDGFSGTGAVIHTRDGGLTWRSEYLPQDGPLIVHAFSPMAVWGSGTVNLAFYRTVNGGDLWSHVSAVGARDHMDDVCAASADDAWGATNGNESDGQIWRVHVEHDGMPDAKNVTPPELGGFGAEGITCLDTRVAWVAAQNERHTSGLPLGIILHTTDGGETWVQGSAPSDIEYWKISFVGARR